MNKRYRIDIYVRRPSRKGKNGLMSCGYPYLFDTLGQAESFVKKCPAVCWLWDNARHKSIYIVDRTKDKVVKAWTKLAKKRK